MSVSVSINLPANAEHVGVVRDLVASALRRFGASAEVVGDMEVVVSEASGNVVRHALGDAGYRVTVELWDGRCDVTVASLGSGIPNSRAMPVGAAEAGRGLALMDALTDSMRVEQDGPNTRVLMTRTW